MNYTQSVKQTKLLTKRGFTPSFDMVCSSMENDNFDNILGIKYFHSDHLYLENDFYHTFYILHFQQLLAQFKISVITYMPYYICVVIHICGITYTRYMNQIQKVIEENHKKSQEVQEQISSLKKIESDLEREHKAINLFENGHVEIIDDVASSVTSADGTKEYLVNCNNGTCQCRDHEHRGKYGIVCCHRIADRFAREAYDTPLNDVVTFVDMEVTV